ncbi:MAG: hypothetical protein CMF50_05765 [Legionellales bacterium]|nr:hypothetical protein [Legionellales bacterium]|tara:strand:+ start:28475 stop:29326 length:852 start_codon:yes stop_codon:yes gene_type:complete
MISKQEVFEQANINNLPANTIEKDYVLNWVLAGIAASNILHGKWIFKGGTCLKKCYFKSYRFSEDLDFTIIDSEFLDVQKLVIQFGDIATWIYNHSGIEVPHDKISFEKYNNPRGNLAIDGKIPFKGPLQRRGNFPTIKLNLTLDEILVEKPIQVKVYHPYSDGNILIDSVYCYSLEEIFAEKLRALLERMSPRDLYDVVNLFFDERWEIKHDNVLSILKKKCHFKNIAVPTLEQVEASPDKRDLVADWNDMLSHQIADLESFEHYWERLPTVFNWLFSEGNV